MGKVKKERSFYDTEHDVIVTLAELRAEYEAEEREVSFSQYVNNCLTRNNGTLEEI